MVYLYLLPFLIILVAAMAALLVRVILGIERENPLPYATVDSVLTAAEHQFAKVLELTVGDNFRILTKIRMADVFRITLQENTSKWWRAFGRIQSKHFDFLLVDRDTWQPKLAIELDDSTHFRYDRQERDRLVNEICRVAGLPLLRVPVRRRWSVEELRSQIQAKLSN